MAQTVYVFLDATDEARLVAIASDRSRPPKHTQRARIVLLSVERLSVQDVAQRAGVSRTAVWRWQRRYADAGVEGLLRDKNRSPGTPPHSTETVAEVLALTCSEPPGEVTHWTGRGPWPAWSGSRCGPYSGSGTLTAFSRIGWLSRSPKASILTLRDAFRVRCSGQMGVFEPTSQTRTSSSRLST